ncbi:hypothetical protein LTR39_001814, partial [Cryomyces antarcticus]
MAIVLFVFVLALFVLVSGTPSVSHFEDGFSISTNTHASIDLSALVQGSSIHEPEVFGQALNIIRSLQTSPSCNRIATATLLNSCSSLDAHGGADKSSTESILDEVKSVYAARLAVCELTGAKATIPDQCSSFVPVERDGKRQGFGGFLRRKGRRSKATEYTADYDDITEVQLEQCLRALESRPQWWTSYSNARQNAVIMCQATRSEIEKDELLSLHKSMAGVTSDITLGLSKAVLEAEARLAAQKQFAESVSHFLVQLRQDMEQAKAHTEKTFDQVIHHMTVTADTITAAIRLAGKDTEQVLDTFSRSVQYSTTEINEVSEKLKHVLKSTLRDTEEIGALQVQNWESSRDMAISVHDRLELVREQQIQALLQELGLVHNGLQMTNELSTRIYERQNAMAEELSNFKGMLGDIQTEARLALETQQEHATIQEQVIGSLQSGAGQALSTIEAVTAKANDGFLAGGWVSLLGVGCGLGFIVYGVGVFSNNAARYLALGTGILWTILASGLPALLSHLASAVLATLSFTICDFTATALAALSSIFAYTVSIPGTPVVVRPALINCVMMTNYLMYRLIRRYYLSKKKGGLIPSVEDTECGQKTPRNPTSPNFNNP